MVGTNGRWVRDRTQLVFAIAFAVVVGLFLARTPWGPFRSDAGTAATQVSQEELLKQMNQDPGAARRLERVDMAISYATPPGTLATALAKAELAVNGTVETSQFQIRADGLVYTFVTMVVDESFKGSLKPGDRLTFMQSGGPVVYPSPHGDREPQLLQAKADPILLPGDRATVFLARADYTPEGIFVAAWPFTSQYRQEGGRVTAVPGNPFAAEVTGLPASSFAERIAEATR